MKKFEFRMTLRPSIKSFPHSLTWSSFVDIKYPLESWFDSIYYTLPEIKLPMGKGMKLKMSFGLGSPSFAERKALNQGPEEPTFPPEEPPYEPNPEKPTIIPEEPIYEPPNEDPSPIKPEVPVRPKPTKLILYTELLLAALTIRALSKLSLSKSGG